MSFHADFLRHGATGAIGFRSRLDDALTDEGWRAMAQTLKDAQTEAVMPWSAVISSPLQRCAAFAQDFAQRHNLPFSNDERLREFDFGAWEGQTAAQLMEKDAAALAAFWENPWQNPPPAGEHMDAFTQRVSGALDDYCCTYAGQHVLIVSHGGVIRLALCLSHQVARQDFLSTEVPHASLHTIYYRAK